MAVYSEKSLNRCSSDSSWYLFIHSNRCFYIEICLWMSVLQESVEFAIESLGERVLLLVKSYGILC